MKVSIVTISFNQGEFLERAIRSVLAQDHAELEYIVVDPGSTDGSRAIIEAYREDFARIILEPDRGPADGLNKAFAVATGEIFGFLNADDTLRPGAVREAVAALAAADADAVYGDGFIIDEQDQVIRHFFSDPFDLWRFIHGGVSIVQQSAFFRRQAYHEVGGFNVENRTCWDREFWLDLALAGKRFCRARRYWSNFRIHRASISGSGRFNEAYQRELFRLFRKATGRNPSRLDDACHIIARVLKWIYNPTGFLLRLRDCTLGAGTIRA